MVNSEMLNKTCKDCKNFKTCGYLQYAKQIKGDNDIFTLMSVFNIPLTRPIDLIKICQWRKLK